MRTYGRVPDGMGGLTWVEVTTDANGYNDAVWLTTLAQTLKLSLGESPFYSNYGIPAQQSVVQQVFPDFYVAVTQQQFSGYFANLLVSKLGGPTPHYRINATFQSGAQLAVNVPIPT